MIFVMWSSSSPSRPPLLWFPPSRGPGLLPLPWIITVISVMMKRPFLSFHHHNSRDSNLFSSSEFRVWFENLRLWRLSNLSLTFNYAKSVGEQSFKVLLNLRGLQACFTIFTSLTMFTSLEAFRSSSWQFWRGLTRKMTRWSLFSRLFLSFCLILHLARKMTRL